MFDLAAKVELSPIRSVPSRRCTPLLIRSSDPYSYARELVCRYLHHHLQPYRLQFEPHFSHSSPSSKSTRITSKKHSLKVALCFIFLYTTSFSSSSAIKIHL